MLQAQCVQRSTLNEKHARSVHALCGRVRVAAGAPEHGLNVGGAAGLPEHGLAAGQGGQRARGLPARVHLVRVRERGEERDHALRSRVVPLQPLTRAPCKGALTSVHRLPACTQYCRGREGCVTST